MEIKFIRLVFFLISPLLLAGCSATNIRYHGRTYGTVKIGDRLWMSENIATSSYRNGKHIPVINDTQLWTETYSPACGFYNGDTANLKRYGMLYNWYAVDAGELCPLHWRTATHEDWSELENAAGGQIYAGGRIKASDGWKGKHVSGDDLGFRALPAGYRLNEDFLAGWSAVWWTSTEAAPQWVWGRRLDYNNPELMNTLNNRSNGFSVRCVRVKKAK